MTIEIDGSQGEGGGQIVRSSLALALVTGLPVSLHSIRAKRKQPGLRQQHLTAADAAARIGNARMQGSQLGSDRLSFQPQGVTPGEYRFSVSTAGSATLVLQTVLPALLNAIGPSTLTFEGGTHNPLAPPLEFLERAYLPLVGRMGPVVQLQLLRRGFYPVGGGAFRVDIQPAPILSPCDLLERGNVVARRVCAMVANLPLHIAQRECQTIAQKSGWDPSDFEVLDLADSPGMGNVVLIEIESQHVTEVFTGFGRKGLRAERVASEAWKLAKGYLDAGLPVGPHLADQLLLPWAIAAHQGGRGSFRTMSLTQHSTTHIQLLQQLLDVQIQTDQHGPQDVTISLSPR